MSIVLTWEHSELNSAAVNSQNNGQPNEMCRLSYTRWTWNAKYDQLYFHFKLKQSWLSFHKTFIKKEKKNVLYFQTVFYCMTFSNLFIKEVVLWHILQHHITENMNRKLFEQLTVILQTKMTFN